MKQFLTDHSYDALKMFLNQIAISVFGVSLALATSKAGNVTLRNVTSICSVLFYLYLLYDMTWTMGYKRRTVVLREKGEITTDCAGLFVSLLANSVNWLIAVFIALATLFPVSVFKAIGGVSTFLYMALNGMYVGLLANSVGGAPLNSYVIFHFLIPIPALITCFFAYNLGLSDKKVLPRLRKK